MGSRNTELFAAACQLRDASYSQSDAERELIPLYVSDGCSEQEALATIRAPTVACRETHSRRRVTRSISWSAAISMKPPRNVRTAAQIAETVRACAQLNPVEWAEARQRLKTVCGDGLKVADLDRLYREARRDRERTDLPPGESAERYIEWEGSMVYEKESARGVTRQTVADWTGGVGMADAGR